MGHLCIFIASIKSLDGEKNAKLYSTKLFEKSFSIIDVAAEDFFPHQKFHLELSRQLLL